MFIVVLLNKNHKSIFVFLMN